MLTKNDQNKCCFYTFEVVQLEQNLRNRYSVRVSLQTIKMAVSLFQTKSTSYELTAVCFHLVSTHNKGAITITGP